MISSSFIVFGDEMIVVSTLYVGREDCFVSFDNCLQMNEPGQHYHIRFYTSFVISSMDH